MSKVLIINASSTKNENSNTYHLLQQFLAFYTELPINKDDEFEFLNLSTDLQAQELLDQNHDLAQYWQKHEKYLEQLKHVDKLILATPMHNFSIPAILKTYIDKIMIPRKAFAFQQTKNGTLPVGLLTNLNVQILITQGSWLEDTLPWSRIDKYLETIFSIIGAKVNKTIVLSGLRTKNYIAKAPKEIIEDHLDIIKESAQTF